MSKDGSQRPEKSQNRNSGHSVLTECRLCEHCGQEKPLTEFRRSHLSKDGYERKCKECRMANNTGELKLPDPNRRPGTLKDETILGIRAARQAGATIPELAYRHNLPFVIIHAIVTDRAYAALGWP